MKIEIDLDVEGSDAFEEICKESNKTPSEIFNSFIKALHNAWPKCVDLCCDYSIPGIRSYPMSCDF